MWCWVPCSWSCMKLRELLSNFFWLQRRGSQRLTCVLSSHFCEWEKDYTFHLTVWQEQWSVEPWGTQEVHTEKEKKKESERSERCAGQNDDIEKEQSSGFCSWYVSALWKDGSASPACTFPRICGERMPGGCSVGKASVVIWIQTVYLEFVIMLSLWRRWENHCVYFLMLPLMTVHSKWSLSLNISKGWKKEHAYFLMLFIHQFIKPSTFRFF